MSKSFKRNKHYDEYDDWYDSHEEHHEHLREKRIQAALRSKRKDKLLDLLEED